MDPTVHFNGTCKFLLQQLRALAAALAVLTFFPGSETTKTSKAEGKGNFNDSKNSSVTADLNFSVAIPTIGLLEAFPEMTESSEIKSNNNYIAPSNTSDA
jgi:hypothetical protein